MPQAAFEPKIRVQVGARPVALLILALGVAIGGSLSGAPAHPMDARAAASAVEGPWMPAGNLAMAVRKPVRVIPLPVRDDLAMDRR